MDQMSMRQKTRNALERIESLEKTIPSILEAFNSSFRDFNNQVVAIMEVTNALVSLVGQDQVTAAVQESRNKTDADMVEKQKQELSSLVAQGVVAAAQTINDKSVIVGRELDSAGKAIRPGRAQMQLGQIKPEFREKFIGQGVGFTVDTETGGKFEVLEVYDVVVKEAVATTAEAAPEAVATVTEAVTETTANV